MTTLFALSYTALLFAGVFATVALGLAIIHGGFFAFDRVGAWVREARP